MKYLCLFEKFETSPTLTTREIPASNLTYDISGLQWEMDDFPDSSDVRQELRKLDWLHYFCPFDRITGHISYLENWLDLLAFKGGHPVLKLVGKWHPELGPDGELATYLQLDHVESADPQYRSPLFNSHPFGGMGGVNNEQYRHNLYLAFFYLHPEWQRTLLHKPESPKKTQDMAEHRAWFCPAVKAEYPEYFEGVEMGFFVKEVAEYDRLLNQYEKIERWIETLGTVTLTKGIYVDSDEGIKYVLDLHWSPPKGDVILRTQDTEVALRDVYPYSVSKLYDYMCHHYPEVAESDEMGFFLTEDFNLFDFADNKLRRQQLGAFIQAKAPLTFDSKPLDFCYNDHRGRCSHIYGLVMVGEEPGFDYQWLDTREPTKISSFSAQFIHDAYHKLRQMFGEAFDVTIEGAEMGFFLKEGDIYQFQQNVTVNNAPEYESLLEYLHLQGYTWNSKRHLTNQTYRDEVLTHVQFPFCLNLDPVGKKIGYTQSLRPGYDMRQGIENYEAWVEGGEMGFFLGEGLRPGYVDSREELIGQLRKLVQAVGKPSGRRFINLRLSEPFHPYPPGVDPMEINQILLNTDNGNLLVLAPEGNFYDLTSVFTGVQVKALYDCLDRLYPGAMEGAEMGFFLTESLASRGKTQRRNLEFLSAFAQEYLLPNLEDPKPLTYEFDTPISLGVYTFTGLFANYRGDWEFIMTQPGYEETTISMYKLPLEDCTRLRLEIEAQYPAFGETYHAKEEGEEMGFFLTEGDEWVENDLHSQLGALIAMEGDGERLRLREPIRIEGNTYVELYWSNQFQTRHLRFRYEWNDFSADEMNPRCETSSLQVYALSEAVLKLIKRRLQEQYPNFGEAAEMGFFLGENVGDSDLIALCRNYLISFYKTYQKHDWVALNIPYNDEYFLVGISGTMTILNLHYRVGTRAERLALSSLSAKDVKLIASKLAALYPAFFAELIPNLEGEEMGFFLTEGLR